MDLVHKFDLGQGRGVGTGRCSQNGLNFMIGISDFAAEIPFMGRKLRFRAVNSAPGP